MTILPGLGLVLSAADEDKGRLAQASGPEAARPTAEGAAALLASMGGAVVSDEAQISSDRPNTNYLSDRLYSEFTADRSTEPEVANAAGPASGPQIL